MRAAIRRRKIVILAIFIVIIYIVWKYQLDIEGLLENRKCPGCYGTEVCTLIQNHEVQLTGFSRFALYKYFNVKNVYFGVMHRKRVVIKKLAHDSEIADVDKILCQYSYSTDFCSVPHAIDKLFISHSMTNFSLSEMLWGTIVTLNKTDLFNSDIMKCMSKRLLRYILNSSVWPHEKRRWLRRIKEVLYTVLVNPEPLILQLFPSRDEWPFPAYLGACGRVIIESYEGKPFSSFQSSPWIIRAKLAYQMLKMAQQFTRNKFDFALYMTDVNLHNFAVSQDYKLTLIDAEGFIVVDKKHVGKGKSSNWDKQHYSLQEACHGCMSFSIEDLCSHTESDHNYYAVCRSILSPGAYYSSKGFLHDIPPNLDAWYNLTYLLQECATPSVPNGRFTTVPKLLKALEDIIDASNPIEMLNLS